MDTPYDKDRGPVGARLGRRSPHASTYDFNSVGLGDYGGPSPAPGTGGNKGSRSSSQQQAPIMAEGPPGAPGSGNLVARLKARVRQYRDAYMPLQEDYNRSRAQVQDYQARLKRTEDNHRLEVQRLRKEADYHKRLRQGAEARATQLAKELDTQQRQAAGFDEAQSGLIQQSQVLVATNSELKHKLQQAERELAQQQEVMAQLTLQLEQLATENEQLRQEYDQMVAGKFADGQGALANMATWGEEDEYDYELYGENAGDMGPVPSTPEPAQPPSHPEESAQGSKQTDNGTPAPP